MTMPTKKLGKETGIKLKEVTLTVSKYGVTVAISYFFLVSRLGIYASDRTTASLPPGCLWRGAREEPS